MTISLPIDPADIPTAQEKGVRVVNGVPMFYKKKPMKDFEDRLELLLKPYYPKLRIPDGEPAFLHIVFLYGYTASTPKKRRIDMLRVTTRPDGDNLSKAIIDACADRWAKDRKTRKFHVVRRGFFRDDAQANPTVISRFRTTGTPRTVIVVKQAERQAVSIPQPNP